MELNAKEYAEGELRDAADRYFRDLDALSHEQLASKPGSADRTAYDFTYEIIYVNQRFVKRINGVDPGAPIDGWIYAPEEFCDKERAKADFKQSMDEVLEAVGKFADADYGTEVAMASGGWSIFKIGTFLAKHVNYHDGQLNYLQSMSGDGEVHWA